MQLFNSKIFRKLEYFKIWPCFLYVYTKYSKYFIKSSLFYLLNFVLLDDILINDKILCQNNIRAKVTEIVRGARGR